jgi:sugar lactone lactonase YvrE
VRRMRTVVLVISICLAAPTVAGAAEGNWATAVVAGNGLGSTTPLLFTGESATAVSVGQVQDMAAAANGDIYAVSTVVTAGGDRSFILRVDTSGHIFTLAGGGPGYCDVCNPRSTDIRDAMHLTVAPDGAVWYTEDSDAANRHVVRRISPDGASVARVAGQLDSNASAGDGGPAISAHVDHPRGIAAAPDGSIYVVDSGDGGPDTVRRISGGSIVRVAGTGATAPPLITDPAPALSVGLTRMEDIAVDPADGSVWVTEAFRNIIRKIANPTSMAATVSVEVGLHSYPRDDACGEFLSPDDPHILPFRWNGIDPPDGSPAALTTLCQPFGLSFDAAGQKLYFSDSSDRRIRRLDVATGKVWNVVGSGIAGTYGYGGPAAAVMLHDDLAVLAVAGRVVFADTTGDGNTRIASIANTAPTAKLASEDSAPVQFRPVVLAATGSTDPDGGALTYLWNYGDGSTGQTSTPSATHTFTDASTHTVTLTVVDDDGASAATTIPLSVRPLLLAPIAAFSASVKRLAGGRWRLTLDGSPSYNAGGAISRWKWKFSDSKTGSGRRLTRVFAKLPPKLGVALTVTAEPGLGTASTQSTVLLPRAAKAKAIDSDQDSVPDAKDRCPHVAATADADKDGCDGPYVSRRLHNSATFTTVSQPFAVSLTSLKVTGYAARATVQLVCDRGCGAANAVLGTAKVAKNGTAVIALGNRVVQADSQLSVRGMRAHWVSIKTPVLVSANAGGGLLIAPGNATTVCSIANGRAVSPVPCAP